MNIQDATIDAMFKSGAQYGYQKSRRHPSTMPYIFGTKNGVDIIDIEKTKELLDKSLIEVKALASSGKTILFVGTKPEARSAITETALSLNMPYVNERWVGGILTNFQEIKKRVAKLLDLRDQKEKGLLEKYTKKERILLEKEVEDMARNFQGLVGMNKIPDAMFVVDPKKEHIAVTEANKVNIPIISLLNTDCNLKEVKYPIVSNDASLPSIEFFLEKIKQAYRDGSKGEETK